MLRFPKNVSKHIGYLVNFVCLMLSTKAWADIYIYIYIYILQELMVIAINLDSQNNHFGITIA